jgi:mRNA-degrading endonuclease toxin of MazEF toxin-antitoxin module
MNRGDVVIVEFPYVDGRRGKNRPALIVQNDRDNRRLGNTVIAMISGNTRHANEPSQVLVDPKSKSGNGSGLHGPSVVKCCNLYTIRQQDVLRVTGRLSDELLSQVNSALRAALELD